MAEPIATVSSDLDGDGIPDKAELTRSADDDGMVDLAIYLGQNSEPETVAHEIVWIGGPGQIPELRVSESGSLLVNSMNIGIGRNKWQQTLTIAWRDGAFVLAGFTYDWYDGTNMQNQGSCDVNLLTGKGILSLGEAWVQTRFATNAKGGPIDKWQFNYPDECGLG
ncbi:MAG: hypothetical protein KUG69_11895 [Marinosulfonomonas sp.]|nr:hypothetical protein [Marinosulfonomonas sp.]